jgi:hypothetical protein
MWGVSCVNFWSNGSVSIPYSTVSIATKYRYEGSDLANLPVLIIQGLTS